jgi:CTP:molybdopterin cytidylyltransferase MocA
MARSPAGPEAADVGVAGLVLAAGAGERFGSSKQLAPLGGRPLLEHALEAIAGSSALERFVVVLGAAAEEVLAGVELHGGEAVVCEHWREGQSASLRAGVAACPGAEAVVVILGDQPLISPRAIDRVVAGRRPGAAAVRAGYGGRPGHPILLERRLLDEVPALHGDAGARELLAGAKVVTVPCDGFGDPLDVDTPDRLSALQSRLAEDPGPIGSP